MLHAQSNGAMPIDFMIAGHERTLLSAALNGGELPSDVEPGTFIIPAHRQICGAIRSIQHAGSRCHALNVTDRLRDLGQLEAVGGPAQITGISLETATPNVVEYALERVRENSQRRLVAKIAEEMQRGDLDATQARELLEKLEEERGGESVPIHTAGEMLALPRDEHSCLLGDRLLARAQSLVIAGVGGIGKTRLVLQLLVALIIGRPWCGLETHARGLRCLFLQTENSTHRLQDDLSKLRDWTGNDWPKVTNNLLISEAGMMSLSDPSAARGLEGTIRHYNPDIIAVDPLRDFAFGDLNSDADMAYTLRELGRICRVGNPDRALVVLHHALTGKAGVVKSLGYERTGFGRNSKVLQTWARGMINVVPGAEENNEQLVLTCGKNSNGREFPPVAVRLDLPSMIYETDDAFDVDSWRDKVCSPSASKRRTFNCQ